MTTTVGGREETHYGCVCDGLFTLSHTRACARVNDVTPETQARLLQTFAPDGADMLVA